MLSPFKLFTVLQKGDSNDDNMRVPGACKCIHEYTYLVYQVSEKHAVQTEDKDMAI